MMEDSSVPTKLGDILCFKNGKSIKPGRAGSYPVYGSNGLIGRSDESSDERAVIIGRVGANCGSIAFCPGKFWASDNTIVAYPKDDSYHVRYLAYLLKQLNLNRWAGGAAQPLLTQTVLKQIEAPIPPYSAQARIVSLLSNYDDLIENNLRRIKILEEMAQALYREWFVHFRFPGHEKVRLVDSPLGKIPEGWHHKTLIEMAGITMGQSPKSIYYNLDRKGLPFHQGVRDFGSRFPSHKVYCTVQNRLAEPGDILFSVRAPVGRINIAKDRIIIGRGLAAIRSRFGQQNLLFYALKNHFFKEDMIGSGAIYAAITKKDLYEVELIQPSDLVAQTYMDCVQPIDSQIENLYRATEVLARTCDLLLPRLITGELDVSELDIAVSEDI